MTITVNYVRTFPKTHRKIVSVTVTPNRFLRFIGFAPRDFAFEGWGNAFKSIRQPKSFTHKKPNTMKTLFLIAALALLASCAHQTCPTYATKKEKPCENIF